MSNEHRQTYFLKEAGLDIFSENIQERARAGVDYKDKKKKYWVDKDGWDCFAIYPRGLDIAHGDNPKCWQWKKSGNDSDIEVAELVKTRWLEVGGSFWTTGYLCHRLKYKVSFWVQLTPQSNLKNQMVKLTLSRPDGTTQEGQVTLPPDDGEWHELEVGRIYMDENNAGQMNFAMEHSSERWRRGLIIKFVEIKPAK